MAAARLLLLCRRTRALPAEVLRLVQAYLVLHVPWLCPLWVERLFNDKVMATPQCGSRSRSFRIVLAARGTVAYADYRDDANRIYDWGRPVRAPEPD